MTVTGHAALTEPPPRPPLRMCCCRGRAGGGRAADRSGWHSTSAVRVARAGARSDVHLYALPDAGLLPAAGSPVRRGAARRSRRPGSPAVSTWCRSDATRRTITADPASSTRGESALSRSCGRFATGDPADLSAFGAQFGLSILQPDPSSPGIVHNLRTAMIDPRRQTEHGVVRQRVAAGRSREGAAACQSRGTEAPPLGPSPRLNGGSSRAIARHSRSRAT